ncbi:putative signaling protein [Rhodocyclaceae bacterium]|nr:putative signaling protein [Rhodocyclaceae bacterium]
MPSEISVRDILHGGLLCCPPETPVREAARLMVEARCSSVLVEADGQIIGIWTEQDALDLDVADPAIGTVPVADSMSSPVKTLDIDTGIGEAALRFREEKVRHFLVVDSRGARRGIVSQSDIVINQGLEYFIALREIASVFNQRHTAVAGSLPLAEAVRLMRQDRLDAVIVNCPRRGLGILTERDIVRLLGTGAVTVDVADAASYPLITLPVKASLFHARKLFMERRIRHLGVTGDDGELLGLMTFADILANIEHEYVHHLREALRESEQRLADSNHHLRLAAKAFESTFEGILVTDADYVIESVNPAFTRITGYTPEDVIGRTPSLLASGRHDAEFYRQMYRALDTAGYWQGEICNRRKNGEVYVEWLTINAVRDGDDRITNYVAVFTDFTTRKAAEEQMRFLAQHDALTGLSNRGLLRDRLLRAIPHAHRNGRKLAVIFLDLNDFKIINDTLGHEAGDYTLKAVAQRLTGCVRAEDTVSRLGGDEFIVLLEELGSAADAIPVVDKIVEAIGQPIDFGGRQLQVSTSVGISIYPDHGTEPDELVRNADAAMYQAKADDSCAYRFFSGLPVCRPAAS